MNFAKNLKIKKKPFYWKLTKEKALNKQI